MEVDNEMSHSLPSKYVGIPLVALGHSSRKKLSLYLNLEGTLIDEVRCVNNYKGLAELAGFDYLEIKNFEIGGKTEDVLHEWTFRGDLLPTVDRLWSFLHQLERFDILTDCQSYITKDCDAYLEKKARFAPVAAPIQEQEVSQSTDKTSPSTEFMTVSDVTEGTPTKYDAFVCYSPESPDIEFVKELIERLEGGYNMKLFVPERDDLPGMANSTTMAKLIEHRCKRVLIILSPRYLKSESCDFQTKFAQSLSPGARSKKLVPILFESCQIPEILNYITLVDYTKKDLLQWFWSRLASSLKAPLDPVPLCQEMVGWSSCPSLASESSSSYHSRTPCSSSSRNREMVGSSLPDSGPAQLFHSRPSGPSSYSSSSSSNLSSMESASSSLSSSSSMSRSPNQINRSRSPNLISRDEDDFVMVEQARNQQSSTAGAGATPPQLPPTDNRAPLHRTDTSTPPHNKKANTSPKQRKGIFRLLPSSHSSSQNKRSLTPPMNRPLPKIPTEEKNAKIQKDEKVIYC